MPKSSTSLKDKHFYILDTNVLLHDSKSLFAFKDVVIGIPFVVLEELDEFKTESGDKGFNAREVIRTLDELRKKGPLKDGVAIEHDTGGSILKILLTPEETITNGAPIGCDIRDNLIILTVHNLMKEGFSVKLITKDINARVKADSLGIPTEDYISGPVEREKFTKGWITIPIPAVRLKTISPQKVDTYLAGQRLFPNKFVVLHSETNPENYKIFRFLGGKNFKEVTTPKLKWKLTPRNLQQIMAFDLLMDDSVKIVSLIGPAGTGKTLLALLAGLQKVASDKIYKKMLVARPVVALGADIGYLPGDVQEKLHYWMKPIHDNLEFIFSASKKQEYEEEEEEHHGNGRRRRGRKHRDYQMSEVDFLIHRGILSMEAITYMRGRSIPYQFIFIDEVQNMSPHEVKTVVSRAGEGSKIILAGDPHQIDSPYLDFISNGLTVTTEKFVGQSIFGTTYLETSERSKLAEIAAKLL